MNVNLRNVPLERLCVIDIETVRGRKNLTEAEFLLWREKTRDRKTLEYLPDEEVVEDYLKNSPLKAIFGKIVCISLAVFDLQNEMIVTKSFYQGEELEIISSAVRMIADNGLIVAGHNIVGFDLPYLRQRFHILGGHYQQSYLSGANDSGAKPWDLEKCVIDTMVVWKGTSFDNTPLRDLCYAFSLTDPKSEFNGREVSEAYYEGRIEEIAAYCEGDVAAVANLILIFLAKTPMNVLSRTFDTLKSPYQDGEDLELPEDLEDNSPTTLTAVERLMIANEIDQDLEDSLVEYLGEVDEEDIPSLRMVLSAIYFRPKSRKAEKETFAAEIEDVINALNVKKCKK